MLRSAYREISLALHDLAVYIDTNTSYSQLIVLKTALATIDPGIAAIGLSILISEVFYFLLEGSYRVYDLYEKFYGDTEYCIWGWCWYVEPEIVLGDGIFSWSEVIVQGISGTLAPFIYKALASKLANAITSKTLSHLKVYGSRSVVIALKILKALLELLLKLGFNILKLIMMFFEYIQDLCISEDELYHLQEKLWKMFSKVLRCWMVNELWEVIVSEFGLEFCPRTLLEVLEEVGIGIAEYPAVFIVAIAIRPYAGPALDEYGIVYKVRAVYIFGGWVKVPEFTRIDITTPWIDISFTSPW